MATYSNFVQPSIPRLDGNYDHWSMLMEKCLSSKVYWVIVETGFREVAEGIVLSETQEKMLDE